MPSPNFALAVDDCSNCVLLCHIYAAAKCGRIWVGDELIKVNSTDVTHESIMAVRGMILGAVGTTVEMTFVRDDEGKEPEQYTVFVFTNTCTP